MPHLQKQSRGSALPGLLNKSIDQVLSDTQPAELWADRQQQQFFFIECTSGKEEASTLTLMESQAIVAIAGQQGIFDLPPGPGLAVGGIESRGHDRHNPVEIVGRRNQAAAPGSLASGALP